MSHYSATAEIPLKLLVIVHATSSTASSALLADALTVQQLRVYKSKSGVAQSAWKTWKVTDRFADLCRRAPPPSAGEQPAPRVPPSLLRYGDQHPAAGPQETIPAC